MEYSGIRATKSELELLNVLWAADAPLSRAAILANSENKSWKDSSVHILLNGMLEKGLIREAGFARAGKTFGRLFAPNVTVEEYYFHLFKALPEKSRKIMLRHFIQWEDPDEEMIAAMQASILKVKANEI